MAHQVVKDAFENFKSLIQPSDDRLFRDTTLEDVRIAARVIERDQHQRRCQRHLRRIEPLFDVLRKLGVAIEPLSQGVPYLCYIWAPMKLLLQIADEYTKGFEQLIDAYSQIAQHLPRLDRLSATFQDQPDFQTVLADIYADILEFHGHAYQFLRRSGWKHLFDSTWKSFGTRFNAILQRLARGRDLVDKEATSFEILQAKAFRQTLLMEVERQESSRRDWQLRDTIAWLDLKGQDLEQEDLFDRRVAAREPRTCEWILHHPKVLTWLDEDDTRPFLWLRGKPGSGKTTLATHLLQNAYFPPKSKVIYCLCTYGFGKVEKNACNLALRSILAQVVRQTPEVLEHLYENYVKTASVPSVTKIRQALQEVLGAADTTFLIIDGLDECDPPHQSQLLTELTLLTASDKQRKIKVLICSRESKEIRRKMTAKPVLSLNEEAINVSRDISLFTRTSLLTLKDRFQDNVIDRITVDLVRRADGMFLWVNLVVGTLLEQESEQDLVRATQRLPTELPEIYKMILQRLDLGADESKVMRINHILGCLAFAIRPLKMWEVRDLLVLHEESAVIDETTKLGVGVLDMCKPLIEEREDQTIDLIHFSAREFLLHEYSGPRIIESQVQRDLTAACTRYLLMSHCFDSDPVNARTVGDLIKGMHDIFPYVYENWYRHLRAYRKTRGTLPIDPDISNVFSLLANQISRPKFSVGDNPSNSQTSELLTEDLSPSVSFVQGQSQVPVFPPVIEQLLLYRESAQHHRHLPGFTISGAVPERSKDPTTLSDNFSRFQALFESLLEGSCIYSLSETGCDDELLHNFRSRHSKSAFTCRYSGCVRASSGFTTQNERQMHEKLHNARFRCTELTCAGPDGTFTTKAAFKKHMERFHPHQVDVELPKFPKPKPEMNTSGTAQTTIGPPNSLDTNARSRQLDPLMLGTVGMADFKANVEETVQSEDMTKSLHVSLVDEELFSSTFAEQRSMKSRFCMSCDCLKPKFSFQHVFNLSIRGSTGQMSPFPSLVKAEIFNLPWYRYLVLDSRRSDLVPRNSFPIDWWAFPVDSQRRFRSSGQNTILFEDTTSTTLALFTHRSDSISDLLERLIDLVARQESQDAGRDTACDSGGPLMQALEWNSPVNMSDSDFDLTNPKSNHPRVPMAAADEELSIGAGIEKEATYYDVLDDLNLDHFLWEPFPPFSQKKDKTSAAIQEADATAQHRQDDIFRRTTRDV